MNNVPQIASSTTRKFSGFDEAVGPLYENEIRKFFYDQLGNDLVLKSYNMDVNFEGSKAFLEFSEKMPSGTESVSTMTIE